ncbi:MAG TPA: hypothetical protein VHO95_09775, partial [Candidatus Dormibacteraeota bacterium]|nr:hypothetical protein [Candidatus Dormibacteraeota bacterium]
MTQAKALTREPTTIEEHRVAGLRAAMTAHEVRLQRQALAERLRSGDDPEIRLQIAYCDYMTYDFDSALDNGKAAFLGFRRAGHKRRAAVAAAAVGRI